MTIRESFIALFYILDQCYDICQDNDLGGLLGSISPELWTDGKPADGAVYNDWKNQNEGKVVDETNVLQIIYEFISLYEKRFGYNFEQTKRTLVNNVTNDMVQNAVRYIQSMEHKYST